MYQLVIVMETGLAVQPFHTLPQALGAYNMACTTLKARYISLSTAGHIIKENRFPEMARKYRDGKDGS